MKKSNYFAILRNNAEVNLVEINNALKEVKDALKIYGEKANAEMKNAATLTGETRAKVDELLNEHTELKNRLQATEQLTVDLENLVKNFNQTPETMGQGFVNSAEFKAFNSTSRGRIVVPVKNVITTGGINRAINPATTAPLVSLPNRRLTVSDLLMHGTTVSSSVEYARETGFTNNAAPVSENPSGTKAESNITFDMTSAPVVTIAHFIKASRQVLDDAPMMQSYIDGRLTHGLNLKVEQQLLTGSGSGLNISGLMTQATAYSEPVGAEVTAETKLDRIRLAILQVTLAEYDADGIVLNPVDWANIELLKGTDNKYIVSDPQGVTTPRIWGLPVVATQAQTVDNYLVGNFSMAAQVWDRQNPTVEVSTEDGSNFVKNMVTILAETRLAFTVYRPAAFVKGVFGSAM